MMMMICLHSKETFIGEIIGGGEEMYNDANQFAFVKKKRFSSMKETKANHTDCGKDCYP